LATIEKRKKSRTDQILTSVCCPQQNEHIDTKRVAYNHVTAILQQCQKGQKCALEDDSDSDKKQYPYTFCCSPYCYLDSQENMIQKYLDILNQVKQCQPLNIGYFIENFDMLVMLRFLHDQMNIVFCIWSCLKKKSVISH